jgi:hypothetical protein
MISLLLAVALLSATEDPPAAPTTSTGPLDQALVAWEVELSATPSIPIRAVEAVEGGPLLLLAYEDAVEARRLEDGRFAWRRDGLAGAGLELTGRDEPLATIGWSGDDGSGGGEFLLLSAAGGETLRSVPLPEAAAGPPTRLSDGGEGHEWLVPLDGGTVAAFDDRKGEVRVHALEESVAGPALQLLGVEAAFSGSPTRLYSVLDGRVAGLEAHDPRTISVDGEWVYGASERSLCGHRCRVNRRGRLRCRERWCQSLGAPVVAAPHVTSELVVAASRDTFTYAFRRDNGHLAWRARIGQRLESSPLRSGDFLLLVPAGAPRVSSVRLSDGSPGSSVAGREDESFPAGGIVADGLLVVAAERPPRTSLLRAWRLSGESSRAAGD